MMLATGIFRDCSHPAAFPGGRAPLRFRAELGRSARCCQAFAGAGSWIQGFFDLVPGLDHGPLCGPLLEGLVNALLQPGNGQAAARTSNARHPATESAGSSPRLSRQDLRTIAQRTASPEFPAPGNPRAAGRASSPALSGPHGVRETTQAASSLAFRRSAAASSIDRASLRDNAAPGTGSASPRATSPAGASTTAAVRDWQDRLTERVAARLTGTAFGLASASTSSGYLAHQWMIPMDGPAASGELLTFASAGSRRVVGPGASTTPANNGFSPLDPAHHPGGQPIQSLPTAVARRAQTATVSSLSESLRTQTSPVPSLSESLRTQTAPIPSPSEWTKAPPTWAESRSISAAQEFTQELIARANDEPWIPQHVSSSIAQATDPTEPARLVRTEVEPANQSTLQAGENLEALSSMMKRILDEEARRHGIEV